MSYYNNNQISGDEKIDGRIVSIIVTALLPFCIGGVVIAVLLQ